MIKLKIIHLPNLERPWLLKRVDGEYRQHAHLHTKKDCLQVRKLIDCLRLPDNEDYRIACERILTKDEYKRLRKRPRYYNVNKGVKK